MGLIGSGRRRLLESLTASLVTLLLILAAGVQHRIRDVDTSWSAQTRPTFAAEGDPFVWAVGGAGPDEARHLAVEGAGNVYLAGMFSATIDADPGQSTVSLTSADSTDIFLAKYGSGGEVVWAFGVGGTGNDQVYQVSLDPFGKVYLAGSFADEVDFAPGDAVAAVRAGGERDGFVAKFGPAGELLWVTPLNPLGDDAVLALALDGAGNAVAAGLAGNVLLTGTFDGVLDVSGDGAMSLETRGQGDLFVASFAPDGALRWASGIGGPDLDGGMRVAADAAGYVYVAGWSSGDLPLQQAADGQVLMGRRQPGGTDALLAKYSPDGQLAWAHSFGGVAAEPGQSSLTSTVIVDSWGDVLVAGRFFGSDVNFDSGGGAGALRSAGQSDAFVAKYGPDGALRVR